MIEAEAHLISLVVWDVPSPLGEASRFTLKVGAKCSASCPLAGRLVEVRDETGVKVGEGRLSESPWEGTTGLYWTDVSLVAPAKEQLARWSAAFDEADFELAHESTSANFTFRVTKRPDHHATVRVIGRDTQAPVLDAEVRLGPYVGRTNQLGSVDFDVPAGSYDLGIRADGYDAPPLTVEVNGDATVRIEATPALTKAQWEEQLNEFKHIPWE